MPLKFLIVAVEEADAPRLKLETKRGQPVAGSREWLTEAEFMGMNPVALARQMQAQLDDHAAEVAGV